ncbi:hypothetical protein, conserved [Trypanosoma brucei gambiense DAL972]|uniref:Endonuclease/exonuclease/phosphatase domain-containing protein n=1 Tax=Trypanosoma brucei gambiense (strain MHOM/CI/86/DAL972) TaxID=679716 RepID=C9ZXH1_TRYB9|nr:hypothetical protein, conserved [Trypanosoma brucei gambiense DAL972]CBH14115.1 hypothetical protein, conserved [Trypanosoma brucei gambiense DAL972]|eukprot:XP_011776386.1 hypothetical protein, conserved [Trypanosoma brucei gambiense DAL972]
MLRISTPRLDGPMVTGGPVKGLQGRMRSLIKPSVAEHVLRDVAVVRQRFAELTDAGVEDPASTYKPSIPRPWVKAPLSRLSTSVSRRDWFRIMQFNIMADAWSNGGTTVERTTPVHGVLPWVPGFTRRGTDPCGFYPYDHSVDEEVPPFLQEDIRRAYIVNEICYYDPDIVCLQEVNRSFFNETFSKYIRYRGYGTLYQSSRGYKVRALRRGDDPTLLRHKGKIEEREDIGNVILFHKGRFVPILMPGKDLVQHLHFAHIVAMRDRVTNMTLNVACAQFTAGDSAEASEIRLHEARQTMQILDALNRNDTDRSHMSNVICGDFNNVEDEEPCVQFMRERLFSTYDVVGGPRWTTWFHEDAQSNARYQKYYFCNRAGYLATNAAKRAEQEVAKFTWLRNGGLNGRRQDVSGGDSAPPGTSSATISSLDKVVGANEPNTAARTLERGGTCGDVLVEQKQALKADGIIRRTQDFVLYDPKTLALHQVLDVPEDEHIDSQQLLPCSGHPSHHLHLVVDVSFTDVCPDVGEISIKD